MMVSAVSHLYPPEWRRRHWPVFGLLAILAVPLILLVGTPALSQDYGGRAAAVETAPAEQEILSRYTDVQGRMVAGTPSAITAVTNGVVNLEPVRIGDMVQKGQLIATQNSKTLHRQLALLEIRLDDAKLRLAEAIQADGDEADRHSASVRPTPVACGGKCTD